MRKSYNEGYNFGFPEGGFNGKTRLDIYIRIAFYTYESFSLLFRLQKNYSADEDYPYLEKHDNWMAKILTKDMYKRLRDKTTPSGFTLDAIIQTGRLCYE